MEIPNSRDGFSWFVKWLAIAATSTALFSPVCKASCAPLPEIMASRGVSAQDHGFGFVDGNDERLGEIRNSIALAGADADTALSLAAEGAALYRAETVKRDGYAYCGEAMDLAEAGEFRESAQAASKALHVALETGNTDLLGKAYRDLAIAFSYAGQLLRAEQFAALALQYPGLEPEQVIGPATKTLGDVRTRQGRYQDAIQFYETAQVQSPATFRPLVDASLANALILSGDLARAQSVLDAIADPADSGQRAQLQRTRGRLLLAQGRPAEALVLYQRLVEEPVRGDDAFFRAWALDGISESQQKLGHPAEAAQALDEAIAMFDRTRARFRSDEFKMGLFSDLQSVFERAIDMRSKLGQADKAFDVSERSRSRALLDAVAGRAELKGDTGQALDATALQAMLQSDEVVVAYHALPEGLKAWVLTSGGVREVVLPDAPTRVRLESLVNTFRYSVFPKPGYFDDDVPIDAGVKAAVDAQSEFFAHEGKKIFLSERRTSAQDVQVKRVIDQEADTLGNLLLKPLNLPSGARLIIVPHGPLHYLPFQALRLGGQYLIERNPVSIAPSASIALRLAANAPVISPKLLAIGNPQPYPPGWAALSGAEKEAADVAANFGGSAELLLTQSATKAAFKSQLESKQIVHLATHGAVDRLDPLHSHVLFAGEDDATSFLTAKDVLGMDFHSAALVVLSACEIGLGNVRRDDEALGFTRSFLGSGASTLVSSLWEVDDNATQVLMTTFYSSLVNGGGAQDAFREAQLATLRTKRDSLGRDLSNPRFWAPFNLIGNWRLKVEK